MAPRFLGLEEEEEEEEEEGLFKADAVRRRRRKAAVCTRTQSQSQSACIDESLIATRKNDNSGGGRSCATLADVARHALQSSHQRRFGGYRLVCRQRARLIALLPASEHQTEHHRTPKDKCVMNSHVHRRPLVLRLARRLRLASPHKSIP
jgi:hypothetical protein